MKLKVRVVRPPISIFEMRKGKKEVERTGYYEHGWADPDHLFWEVPDGQYMICQGDAPPCIVTVKKGQVTTRERNGSAQKAAGNNVEAPATKSKPRFSTESVAEDVGDILHVPKKPKPKHEDIVVELVDTGESEKP